MPIASAHPVRSSGRERRWLPGSKLMTDVCGPSPIPGTMPSNSLRNPAHSGDQNSSIPRQEAVPKRPISVSTHLGFQYLLLTLGPQPEAASCIHARYCRLHLLSDHCLLGTDPFLIIPMICFFFFWICNYVHTLFSVWLYEFSQMQLHKHLTNAQLHTTIKSQNNSNTVRPILRSLWSALPHPLPSPWQVGALWSWKFHHFQNIL